MFFNKILLYYNTLKYLKPTQLYHQVYYRLKNRIYSTGYNVYSSGVSELAFEKGIPSQQSYIGKDKFSFLNLEKEFYDIDWNFGKYGKLWTYNLNYFDFLHQEGLSKEDGLRLIQNYISNGNSLEDGLEPYPISLRGINWIKFLVEKQIQDEEIDYFLYRDYLRLADNLEYHLLANHLLENGFSLLFGAYYFADDQLYSTAKKVLVQELEEQVLKDGSHYELSPMYHQIILHRVLDSINLVKNNDWKEKEILSMLHEKAGLMLGWLNEISFNNGQIPRLNDSSAGIAPTIIELKEYATRLGIQKKDVRLKESGYRKFTSREFEIVMDVGQISPTYQPAHSHADSLQFVLNYKDKPIIVDTGVSTYEKNERRQLERSTNSHNTVTFQGKNSSEVWGGFRVAKRAKVMIHKDYLKEIEASNNGYRQFGITHNRRFFYDQNVFEVEDSILQKGKRLIMGIGHLHFHPETELRVEDQSVFINNELSLTFSGIENFELKGYKYAKEFNSLENSTKIEYLFLKKAVLHINTLQ